MITLEATSKICSSVIIPDASTPKYVIVDKDGIPTPRLLAPWEQHKDGVKDGDVVLSAGFYRLTAFPFGVSVFGHSKGLEKSSKEDDAEIINRVIFNQIAGGGR